eukprot:scaffold19858_cov56-Attheya_sp.AAC.5
MLCYVPLSSSVVDQVSAVSCLWCWVLVADDGSLESLVSAARSQAIKPHTSLKLYCSISCSIGMYHFLRLTSLRFNGNE